MSNQRWNRKRASYRPAGETIRTELYDVAEVAADTEARKFVEEHHYSGTYPAARFRFGLFARGELVGCAVFSHPCNDRCLTSVFSAPAQAAVELGRFVLLDEVPGNGETWFLARCFELLRREHELVGVVSFSDDCPRETSTGEMIFAGHIGTIFQAANARYLGRGTPRTLKLLPDGRVFSDRTYQKIRAGERGWLYGARILQSYGADEIDQGATRDERLAWLSHWSKKLTRPLRHPGNHKYVWPFERRDRRILSFSLPYPKRRPATGAAQLAEQLALFKAA
jgi:hypothetical protein